MTKAEADIIKGALYGVMFRTDEYGVPCFCEYCMGHAHGPYTGYPPAYGDNITVKHKEGCLVAQALTLIDSLTV